MKPLYLTQVNNPCVLKLYVFKVGVIFDNETNVFAQYKFVRETFLQCFCYEIKKLKKLVTK